MDQIKLSCLREPMKAEFAEQRKMCESNGEPSSIFSAGKPLGHSMKINTVRSGFRASCCV